MTQHIDLDKRFDLIPTQRAAVHAMFSRARAMILMGGAGMGGKSYTLRICAICYLLIMSAMGHKNLKVLFTCIDYPSIVDRHMSEFQRYFGDIGTFHSQHKIYGMCFILKNEAGVICFRNLEGMGGRKGAEYAAWFHDETTECTLKQFAQGLYMIRADVPYSPIVTASNPDGIGFQWVKSWWRPHLMNRDDTVYRIERRYDVIQGQRAEAFSEKVDPDNDMDPQDFIYIPFLPDENPGFDPAAFARAVMGLPFHIRQARRYGLWNAPEGARFPMLAIEIHQFNPDKLWKSGVPAYWDKHLSVDEGYRDPTAALWRAHDGEGNMFFYRELYERGLTPYQQINKIIAMTSETEFFKTFKGDPDMWNRKPDIFNGPPVFTSDIYNDAIADDPRFACRLTRGPLSRREQKWQCIERGLEIENKYPNMYFSERCVETWRELEEGIYPSGTHAKDHDEGLDQRCDDHALTSIFYGCDSPAGESLAVAVQQETVKVAAQAVGSRRLVRPMKLGRRNASEIDIY